MEEAGSGVMRFGAAVTAVILASAVGTLPASMRVAPSLSSCCTAMTVWVAFTAVVLLPMGVATVLLRRAHAALRLFDAGAVSTSLLVVPIWALGSFGALAALGAFLRGHTHHHGLAGTTFAAIGAALLLFYALFSARLVAWARLLAAPFRWMLLALGGLALGAELAAVFRILSGSPGASTGCADVIALVLAAAFGALAFPAGRRTLAPLAIAGPPAAAVVLVLGLAAVRSVAPLRAELELEVPLLSAVLRNLVDGSASVAPPPSH